MTDSNHRTRWADEELETVVDLWDGHRATTEVIAELLGRTPDAVSQRYYEWVWGIDHPTVKNKPTDDTSSDSHVVAQARKTFNSLMIGEEVCSRCFLVKTPTGECGC